MLSQGRAVLHSVWLNSLYENAGLPSFADHQPRQSLEAKPTLLMAAAVR